MYNKSKSLEFKNFRKFADFPAIEFGDITFLVGKNNSGKSTFVKSAMLVFNYLKGQDLRTIDFTSYGSEALNIVSYERALHKSNLINQQNEIQIGITIHDYLFDIRFTSHKEPSKATILDLKCSFWGNTTLYIDPIARTIKLEEGSSTVVATFGDAKEDAAIKEIAKLNEDLALIQDKLSPEYIEINTAIHKLSATLSIDQKNEGWSIEFDYKSDNILEVLTGLTNLIASMPMPNSYLYEFNINNRLEEENEEISYSLVAEPSPGEMYHYDSNSDNWIIRLAMEQKNIAAIQSLYKQKNAIMQFLTGIKKVVTTSEIVYLPASLNKQSALFLIRDEKNPLAQTIHEYSKLLIDDESIIHYFIKHWLKEFEIGEDFKIELIQGEAYTLEILQDGIWISLADKGMGAIQATLLILRLASLIHSQIKEKNGLLYIAPSDGKNYIVVLEEPELNLHPALQSKLCDLFFEVNLEYQIEFIIETHSEYMIRKSQLITAQNNFESPIGELDNLPFSTLYFPSEDGAKVYSMEYRKDGKFKNEFGPGFFDESTNLAFELL